MKIVHISDLHFGRDVPEITDVLLAKISALQPDLCVISGDFTQNATEAEFLEAKGFIDRLPCAVFCVPGNHDIPNMNLVERFFAPLKKYKEYITEDLNPVYIKDDVKIVGINSARRALPHWNWANGAISNKQRGFIKQSFKADTDRSKWKIFVLHHPIHKVDDMPLDVTVFGRKKTLQVLEDLRVDLVLTGHVHHSTVMSRGTLKHETIYTTASTALSSRTRTQENGFNVVSLNQSKMEIVNYVFENNGFTVKSTYEHMKRKG